MKIVFSLLAVTALGLAWACPAAGSQRIAAQHSKLPIHSPQAAPVPTEPETPSVVESIAFINHALAIYQTPQWADYCAKKSDTSEFTILVDEHHQTLYVKSFNINDCKTDDEPQRFIVANLDTSEPIEGDPHLDISTGKTSWPLICPLKGWASMGLHCKGQQPCVGVFRSTEVRWVEPPQGLLVGMSGSSAMQRQVAGALQHLVKLMQQENGVAAQ